MFFIAFLSTAVFAHEVQLATQHIKINKQNETAWQSDFLAKAAISPRWMAGLQGTYLERFDLYERRAGGFVVFNPIQTLTIEARYLRADSGAQILAEDQYSLSLYHALTKGIAPYISYQNSLYSSTHLQTLTFGVEFETIPSFILIPQIMIGQAQLLDPAEVKEVNSFGMKIIYYREQIYSLSIYAYKGVEAAQSLIGIPGQNIDTKSIGIGAGYYFFPKIKTEIIFDYTDLGELDNQFLSSTLNLAWAF